VTPTFTAAATDVPVAKFQSPHRPTSGHRDVPARPRAKDDGDGDGRR
jgi:hypothetical protein